MKTTRYFEEQVMRKRPYLKREWCDSALQTLFGAKFNLTDEYANGFSLKN